MFGDVKNQNIDGIEMIPLRFMSEMLGWQVNWISESKTIEMNKYNDTRFVTFEAESTSISYGDSTETLILEYPNKIPLTIIIDGVTYISCYDFCRVIGLKLSNTASADYKLNIYTDRYSSITNRNY